MKQKIGYGIFLLVTVIAVLVNTGCPTRKPAGEDNIKDGLIPVNPPKEGIIGKDPSYDLPDTQGGKLNYKGVFIKGRKVKLSPYRIGKTPVTYELWWEVKEWAKTHGYTFAYEGLAGSIKGWPVNGVWENVGKPPIDETKKHPVTFIVFPDLIVWCNAYTEKVLGAKECVYRHGSDHSVILKTSSKKLEDQELFKECYADMTKKGFRLPTEAEWEFAARYNGDGSKPEHKINAEEYGSGVWLTNLNSVSGAKKVAPFKGLDITKYSGETWESLRDEALRVCRFNQYWDGTAWKKIAFLKNIKTADVASKEPNFLGLYDMSGNVNEYCFDRSVENGGINKITDWDTLDKDGFVVNPQGAGVDGLKRVIRGGAFSTLAEYALTGYRGIVDFIQDSNEYNSFRLVRTQ